MGQAHRSTALTGQGDTEELRIKSLGILDSHTPDSHTYDLQIESRLKSGRNPVHEVSEPSDPYFS